MIHYNLTQRLFSVLEHLRNASRCSSYGHSIANMPVHHLVFLRLADGANSDAVMDALRGLVGVIPGLVSFAGGANTSTEGEEVTGHASCSRSQDLLHGMQSLHHDFSSTRISEMSLTNHALAMGTR
jgi:hypothetical protein